MPDGLQITQPGNRDLKNSTAIRVAEIVMAPLTMLVVATMVLAGMVLWGVWTAVRQIIRPLLYSVAGIFLVALVLLNGGIMGYAFHAYQTANGKLQEAPPEIPPAAPDLPRAPSTSPQTPPKAPQADPFGLKQ